MDSYDLCSHSLSIRVQSNMGTANSRTSHFRLHALPIDKFLCLTDCHLATLCIILLFCILINKIKYFQTSFLWAINLLCTAFNFQSLKDQPLYQGLFYIMLHFTCPPVSSLQFCIFCYWLRMCTYLYLHSMLYLIISL